MSLFFSVHRLFVQMNSDYVQPYSSCCKWSLYKFYWTWTTKVFPHYDINFILYIIHKICHSYINLNRKSVVYFCKNLQSIYFPNTSIFILLTGKCLRLLMVRKSVVWVLERFGFHCLVAFSSDHRNDIMF